MNRGENKYIDIRLIILVLPILLVSLLSCCDKAKSSQKPDHGKSKMADNSRSKMSLVTYNVLADPVGVEKRIPPLLKLLDESNADIIALQEVAPWFLKLLLKEKWVSSKNYSFTTSKGRIFAPGGQLILSKIPITKTTFQSSCKKLL
jgi:hypothetical protein